MSKTNFNNKINTKYTAIYARAVNNENNSLSKQLEELINGMNRYGETNYRIYAEVASGLDYSEKREELNRLLEDCRKGKIKSIYISSFETLGRDIIKNNTYLSAFAKCGIDVYRIFVANKDASNECSKLVPEFKREILTQIENAEELSKCVKKLYMALIREKQSILRERRLAAGKEAK